MDEGGAWGGSVGKWRRRTEAATSGGQLASFSKGKFSYRLAGAGAGAAAEVGGVRLSGWV